MATKGEILSQVLIDLGNQMIEVTKLIGKVSGGVAPQAARGEVQVRIEAIAKAMEPLLEGSEPDGAPEPETKPGKGKGKKAETPGDED